MKLSEDYLNDLSIINKIDSKDEAYTWLLKHGHGITTANLVLSYWRQKEDGLQEKSEEKEIVNDFIIKEETTSGVIINKDFGAEKSTTIVDSIISSVKKLKKGSKK